MRKFQSFIILSFLVLLAACIPQAAAVTPTAVPATETFPSPTSTLEPTITPTLEPSPMATEIAEELVTEEIVLQPPENLEIDEYYLMTYPMISWDKSRFHMHAIERLQVNKEDIVIKTIKLSDDVVMYAYATVWTVDENGQAVYYNVPALTIDYKNKKFTSLGATISEMDTAITEEVAKKRIENDDLWESGNTQYFEFQFPNLDASIIDPVSGEININNNIAFWSSIPLWEKYYTQENLEKFVETGDPSFLEIKELSDELPPRFITPIVAYWIR